MKNQRPSADQAWEYLKTAPDEEIPLIWGALVIARDEYPDLDIESYELRMADFGERVRQKVDADPMSRVRAVNTVLFEELGFSGNQKDYYDPKNSYLNDVIDRKLGIPISLALLQIDVAHRVGLPLQGISFPGHFLVSLPVEDGVLVLDPYHKGTSVDVDELKSRAKSQMDDVDVQDDQVLAMLVPATHRAILTRMLRNLKALYAEREDWTRALRCTDRILILDPRQPSELRDRGLLYLKVGYAKGAAEDLTRYIAENPQLPDSDEIRELLVQIPRSGGRVN
jgi:regulator of sirC expression with transglutaminase-like and TPR domain